MNIFSNLFQTKASKGATVAFWSWFSENSDTLFSFEKDREKVLSSLGIELKKLHPHITFEIGPDVDSVRELIISADGFKDAISAVEETVKQAPALPQWKVIAFRQPVELVMTAYYGNVILPPEDVWFKAAPKLGKVDVQFFINGFLPTKKTDYTAALFLQLDHLLGEYTVMTKVGAIDLDILPADPPAAGLKPFEELKAAF